MSTLIAIWNIASWLRQQKKEMEANAEAYLTRERAKEWRETSEKIFQALESGNGNMKRLPTVVQWFFKHTKADNNLGTFGMWYLKSEKLAQNSSVLSEPIKLYPCH